MSTTVFATDTTKCRVRPGPPRFCFEPRRGDKQKTQMQRMTDDDDDESDDDARPLSLSPTRPWQPGGSGDAGESHPAAAAAGC